MVNSKTGDSVSGATVTATDSSGNKFTAMSDVIGDFYVDGLATNTTYQIAVSISGYASKTVSGVVATNNYLGDVTLTPS